MATTPLAKFQKEPHEGFYPTRYYCRETKVIVILTGLNIDTFCGKECTMRWFRLQSSLKIGYLILSFSMSLKGSQKLISAAQANERADDHCGLALPDQTIEGGRVV